MNDDVINDLKQFITATVSQQATQQTQHLEKKIDDVRVELNSKIDDLSTSIGDALDTSNETVDAQIKDHEHRITKLEHRTA